MELEKNLVLEDLKTREIKNSDERIVALKDFSYGLQEKEIKEWGIRVFSRLLMLEEDMSEDIDSVLFMLYQDIKTKKYLDLVPYKIYFKNENSRAAKDYVKQMDKIGMGEFIDANLEEAFDLMSQVIAYTVINSIEVI